jgi:prephenate dehydrogenase
MKKVRFPNVVLVGVGLMGGSLARALLRLHLATDVVGFGRSRKSLAEALKLGLVTRIGGNLKKELAGADLVVLAQPVCSIRDWIVANAQFISPKALVVDLGSTKAGIIEAAERYFTCGQFVGCHPMAGTEKSGPRAAVINLFRDKTCFIVKSKASSSRTLNLARALWQSVGANPVLISATAHDKLMAWVSHVPQAVASALMLAVGKTAPSGWRGCVGSGFRDTTRIAASPAGMWTDIFLENAENVADGLKSVRETLGRLEKAVRSGRTGEIEKFMATAAKVRKQV